MAFSVIKGPRELHSVRSADEYRAAHARQIAARRSKGHRVSVHEVSAPKVARVDYESGWIIDCECGAGNSTDPEWRIACCLSCGAIHRHVIVPEEWAVIERLLLARPQQRNRCWRPHETVEDVRAINRDNGVSDAVD